jgi:putative transposase
MPRKRRIEYKGALYHVIQRGNNREYIFENELYKNYLIKIIRETKKEYGFKLYGYVIMDNHYHLIIQTIDVPISKIMHNINFKYGKYYNYKEKRVGPVFEGRYRGLLVEDERYLLQLLKYIHLNPIKAEVCTAIDKYKWSSDVFYRRNMKNIVDIDEILDMISSNRIKAIKKYITFMDDKSDDKQFDPSMFENLQVLRNDKLKEQILTEHNDERMSLDDILKEVCPSKVEYNLIKSLSRKRYLTQYKIKYVKKARTFNYSYSEIGNYIGVSDVAVIKLEKK